MAELLASVPGVSSFHEPVPYHAQIVRLLQTQPHTAYSYLHEYKFPAINHAPGQVYAETSHTTCKGFIEPLINIGLRPAWIVLRRPPRQVAWSLTVRNAIPARTTAGVQDLLEPRDKWVTPLLEWESASNYQLCYWYALEIERRQLAYTDLAQKLGMSVVDITCRELNDWTAYARMLTALNLHIADDAQSVHAQISSKIHNGTENPPAFPDELKEEEETVWTSVGHYHPLLRVMINARYEKES